MSDTPRSERRDVIADGAADLDWLHALARVHVHDASAAEDLAHDVWILALTKGQAAVRRRAWMRRVLRNELQSRVKREQLRSQIEKRVAREEESVPSASEVASAREQQRLVEALLARLADSYRTVLSLRFLESKPPRQIAEDLGLPVETVRTRTRRGILILRALL